MEEKIIAKAPQYAELFFFATEEVKGLFSLVPILHWTSNISIIFLQLNKLSRVTGRALAR